MPSEAKVDNTVYRGCSRGNTGKEPGLWASSAGKISIDCGVSD